MSHDKSISFFYNTEKLISSPYVIIFIRLLRNTQVQIHSINRFKTVPILAHSDDTCSYENRKHRYIARLVFSLTKDKKDYYKLWDLMAPWLSRLLSTRGSWVRLPL